MTRIAVPQPSGEILISRAGDEPTVYKVKNGTVDVDEALVDGFLRQVPGSSVSEGKSGGESPKKEA